MTASTAPSTEDGLDLNGIEPLPSGSFRFRFQYAGKSIRGTYPTAKEAALMRDEAKRQIARRNMVVTHESSIVQLGASFLASRRGNRAHSDDKDRWDLHLANAPFAHRAPSGIVRRDILSWLDKLKTTLTSYKYQENTKYLSWQTRKHLLNLLRWFFDWAIDREIVKSNPCDNITVPREDGDEDEGYQEGWYLDGQEQAQASTILQTIEGKDAEQTWFWRAERHLIDFAIGTGLRQGEQFCLHLADVHVEGDDPHVAVRYGSWDPERKRYRPPKGRKGEKKIRIVPLFGLGLAAVRAQLAILPRYTKKNPHKLLFPNTRGGRRTKPPAVWKTLADKMGIIGHIGRRIWWHLLRHTCASSLVAGWWGMRWPLEDVSKFLGHSSVKVTERYAHLAPSVLTSAADRAEAAWQSRCHEVATASKNAGENGHFRRPSKPDVVGSNPSARAQAYPKDDFWARRFDGRANAWKAENQAVSRSGCCSAESRHGAIEAGSSSAAKWPARVPSCSLKYCPEISRTRFTPPLGLERPHTVIGRAYAP